MITLSLPKDPYWIDVGYDVRMKVRPCTTAIFYQARAFMNQKLQALGESYRAERSTGISHLPDLEDPHTREALAEQFLTIGLARAGIMEWEGILNVDSDDPAPVTDEKIDELFGAYWMITESFRHQYTGMREVLEAEKNACRPVSTGTSETGHVTAETVPNTDTPAPKATRAKTAKSAPTSRTPSRP